MYILLITFRHTVIYENFLIYTKTLSLSLSLSLNGCYLRLIGTR